MDDDDVFAEPRDVPGGAPDLGPAPEISFDFVTTDIPFSSQDDATDAGIQPGQHGDEVKDERSDLPPGDFLPSDESCREENADIEARKLDDSAAGAQAGRDGDEAEDEKESRFYRESSSSTDEGAEEEIAEAREQGNATETGIHLGQHESENSSKNGSDNPLLSPLPIDEDNEEQAALGSAPDDTLVSRPEWQIRLEVAIPELSPERRSEYDTVYSEIIESVLRDVTVQDERQYLVEYTDGREETLSEYENGESALFFFNHPDADMATTRKRKQLPDDDWAFEEPPPGFEPMDLDEDDDLMDHPTMARRRRNSIRTLRSNPSREMSNQRSPRRLADSDDDSGSPTSPPKRPTRTLRTRPPRQLGPTMALKSSPADPEQDELLQDPAESDDDAPFIVSDIKPQKSRPSRARQPSRRQRGLTSRSGAANGPRGRTPGSDIEFEAPRRSGRATRTTADMRDEALMDEDSFYVADDRAPAVPKATSTREIFQTTASDSKFASIHMSACHTCGSRHNGQLIHCQGCTLSYHKHCLGPRSAREHVVTKIGEDSFVLQCRFCVGIYRQKDKNAPRHGMCQECRGQGKACGAFSQRKTPRQEEKLREQNGGVDPVTPVSPTLVDNPDVVLFRCSTCHRGWHVEHLPAVGNASVGTDVKEERLADYTVDWRCNECSSAKHKIHRLIAWRPTRPAGSQERPSYADVDEDGKEYLVKWDTVSYAHCSWLPAAWVFGTAAGAMRTSFGKRAAEQDLLKPTEKEAVPDEYVMPDIILNVKTRTPPRGRSKKGDMDNISNVSKIFVKFQGLGYDDVVWDTPPPAGSGEIYDAFVEAYGEYVEGKYFHSEPQSRIRDRVRAYKDAAFEEVDRQPAALTRGKLMGYQLEGLNWLLKNYHSGRSVVLADEMGLGKTVQVISLVASLIQDKPKCWPFLIVVPNATCPNWRREFKQWTPDLRVVTYHGGREAQELAYKYELFPSGAGDMKAHVVIMSYDSAQDPRTKPLFKTVRWAGLVVDEGQRLKNDQNLLYLALRTMKIPFRLLLTGTPLQNNKRELFNLLQFIDESQNATKLDEEFETLSKDNLPQLHDRIRPYFLRRTKAGVLKFLPPMAQIILPVTMTVIQEKLSKSIMAKNPQLIKSMFANSRLSVKDRGSLNNILVQLRKCLCHPFMYSEAIEERDHDPAALHRNLVEASAKLILLEIMLPKLRERGHRVLIFSQFLTQLDIVEDFLSGMGLGYRRLDGQISSLEKQRRIDAFNAPGSPLFAFLLSTRAGGVGINLATADTVIIMDPDFNPHQDVQALSRAHRIGQKQKVLCFQLMTKDSVEETIMQVGRKKMALDHALIESMDDDELAGDDLESILKRGAQALFNEDYQKTAIAYDSASVDALLDRTQVEKTKTSDDGSAESQFSYARVWANERSGFDDGLGAEEEQAPEPISSSVWDKILAQREEEAKREAEANREVLGRGGRRRMAINYKANGLEGALPEGDAAASDSSDNFSGANSADDSDEAEDTAKDANEVKALADAPAKRPQLEAGKAGGLVQGAEAAAKKPHGRPRKVRPAADPKQAEKVPRGATQGHAHKWKAAQLQTQGQAPRPARGGDSNGPTGPSRLGSAIPHGASPGQWLGQLNGVGGAYGQAFAHQRPGHPQPHHPHHPYPHSPHPLYQLPNDFHNRSTSRYTAARVKESSEAEVRLLLDELGQPFAPANDASKAVLREPLLRRLRELSVEKGLRRG